MQLRDIGREDAYKYELQYSRRFEDIAIKHGDFLSTTCIYNSMERTVVTPGGLASRQEMCFNIFLAYPASCRAPQASLNALEPACAHVNQIIHPLYRGAP
jgi:hypothetical protein